MLRKRLIAASGLFLIGMFFMLNSPGNITGAVVGAAVTSVGNSGIGLFFIILSAFLFLSKDYTRKEKKIELTSAIDDYKGLCRLAEDAARNQDVQKDIDNLIRELGKGNLEAGLGSPCHIKGTDIFYLRASHGGRLYYHKIEEDNYRIGYEIVAKSSKANQDKVMKKLRELYSK